jgi:hypothetical protein
MMMQNYEAIYCNGQMTWLGKKPSVKNAKVLVTILEVRGDALDTARHKPSERIAGKGKIFGDIISPVSPFENWNCVK